MSAEIRWHQPRDGVLLRQSSSPNFIADQYWRETRSRVDNRHMSRERAFILEAARTPFGSYFGGLSSIRPDDLLASAIKEVISRISNITSSDIDDVIIGDSNGAGEDNRNVARMSSLLAGLPVTVPGLTVNRLCGSGAEAIVQASRSIKVGDCQFVIAGGVESMSRAPWILQRSEKKSPETVDPSKLHQSTVGWRMTNPEFSQEWTQSLGRCAEAVAEKLGISRLAQDQWALRSHQKAATAWDQGKHDGFVFPINNVMRDESIRADSSASKLAELKSAFSQDGAGTAGNSSPINDGAVALLLTNESGVERSGQEIICEILTSQVVGIAPNEFTRAPVFAIRKLLEKMQLSFADIALWEINEAFAAMVLTVLHELPEIDPELVNVNGGAIALGHPIGGSAARVVVDCARELKRRGGGIGIAAACIGVGQGIAIAVKV